MLVVLVIVVAVVTASAAPYFAVNTWSGDFEGATSTAFHVMSQLNGTALDAIEAGCTYCEEHQCDTTVGFGNHPDTHAHTSLDAMIMDGNTFDMGAVGYLRRHRKAITIARKVMFYTGHTLLVGEGAEEFADSMGVSVQSTTTANTEAVFQQWRDNNCQPNFYENIPEAKIRCGPYPIPSKQTPSLGKETPSLWKANKENHDTIGMITRDLEGNMACGTSTNGASHKVAGRIGDSPIPGAGCYVNTAVGGATATGDGDVMMRFLPSFYAVTLMEAGKSPKEACSTALGQITKIFPTFSGGLVCITKDGEHAGATNNMDFSYSLMQEGMSQVQVIPVTEDAKKGKLQPSN